MKDLLEYKSTSLTFGLFNGWDITFEGLEMLTVINETSSNSFWVYLFNFGFLMYFERFNSKYWFNLNITSNLIN